MMMELSRIAYHEAAHCFVGWFLGVLIKKITISGPVKNTFDFVCSKAENCTPYYCDMLLPGMTALRKINKDDVFINMDTAFAPAAFESQKYGSPSDYCLEDIFRTMQELTPRDTEVAQIAKEASRIIRDHRGREWEAGASEFFEKYGFRVKELSNMPQAMKAVEALADELFNRGQLSGREAVDILESAWEGPLPEKAKPAREHSPSPDPLSIEDSLVSAERLVRNAFNTLREYSPKNDSEETIIETAVRQALGAVFIFNDLLAKHESTKV